MSSGKRCLAWGLVGLITAWSLLSGGKPPAEPPDLPPQRMARLASLSPEQVPEWLAQLEEALAQEGPPCQALIVQSAPDMPPMVVAAPTDDSGDESATHWPVPWSAVIEAMKQPIRSPLTVPGNYSRLAYSHRLLPLDETGTRCLLLNRASPARPLLGWRGAGLLLATVLGAMLLVRSEE